MRNSFLAAAGAALILCGIGSAHAAPPKKAKTVKLKTAKAGKWVTTKSGLKYMDVVVGKGAMPKHGQRVKVHYVGTLTNGSKFDSSRDRNEPFEFTLGVHEVIEGWDEGVATMHVGGKRKLVVPPALGYRDHAMGPIPPNSTLNFEVELLGVQ